MNKNGAELTVQCSFPEAGEDLRELILESLRLWIENAERAGT